MMKNDEMHLSHEERNLIRFVLSAYQNGDPYYICIVYINDLDEKMTSTVLKFADDIKISSNSQQELQGYLNTAVE